MPSVRYSVPAICLMALTLIACAGYDFAPFGAESLAAREINRAYADRDACLVSHISSQGGTDSATMARSAAAACQPQTDRLVVSSNPGRDPQVTAAIRQDTEFRALKYAMRVRGERGDADGIAERAGPVPDGQVLN